MHEIPPSAIFVCWRVMCVICCQFVDSTFGNLLFEKQTFMTGISPTNAPRKTRRQKVFAVLPTLLTLCNAACGFGAITIAAKIGPEQISGTELLVTAAQLIFLAMLFDMLDGSAARLTNQTSDFGAQLDSLCDAISFGVAPGFLLYAQARQWSDTAGQLASLVAVLYVLCAVVRLARFNVSPSTPLKIPGTLGHHFTGLPSPVAAGCVACFALIGHLDLLGRWAEAGGFPEVQPWMLPGCLLAALLMISPFPYAHLAKDIMRPGSRLRMLIPAILAVVLAAFSPPLALAIIFWAYALHAPLRAIFLGLRRAQRSARNKIDRIEDSSSGWHDDQ